MPSEEVPASTQVTAQLAEILEILKRIEARQIKTTAMVEDVKEHEAPVVGSFASIDHGTSEDK